VRDQPGLTTYTTHYSFPVGSIGKSFAFQLEAYNVIGSVFSTAGASFTLADLPSDPTLAPASDESFTTDTQIKIDIAPITSTGGSPILSYSLEVDDGQGGLFVPVFGLSVNSLSTSYKQFNNVTRGSLFRARYRVKNIIGWTDYSPISYIMAAVPPSQPAKPNIITASSTLIQIQIQPSIDDGGSTITSYELYRDDGALGAFTKITSYDGLSSSFDLSLVTDPALVVGKIYSF